MYLVFYEFLLYCPKKGLSNAIYQRDSVIYLSDFLAVMQ